MLFKKIQNPFKKIICLFSTLKNYALKNIIKWKSKWQMGRRYLPYTYPTENEYPGCIKNAYKWIRNNYQIENG